MFKKAVALFLTAVFALTLFGCGSKKEKAAEFTPEQQANYESLARAAVTLEVFSKYGYEPEVTVEKITDYKVTEDAVNPRTTFTATGTYSVTDGNGEEYTGTFTAKCFSEDHGSGWDSCEISVPKNGSKELPEFVLDFDTEPETSETTTAETTVLELVSDSMIDLSEQFISDGYKVDVLDPADAFDQYYGAKEAFRAYDSNTLIYVYLYDTKEEAENAEFMMYKNTEGTVSGVVEANTYFIADTVLVAEFTK